MNGEQRSIHYDDFECEKRVMNKLKLLKQVPLFLDLANDQLDDLASRCTVESFSANEVILHEGGIGEQLYILESGTAKVYVGNPPDEELVLFFMQHGDFVGDIALLDDSFRSASVVALDPCVTLCISKIDFHRLLDGNPDLARSIILSLTRRLREDNKRIRSLALDPVYRRLRDKLYELAITAEKSEFLTLPRKFTHREIGAMIGASRKMVSKLLSDLVVGGYIEFQTRIIVIVKKLPKDW